MSSVSGAGEGAEVSVCGVGLDSIVDSIRFDSIRFDSFTLSVSQLLGEILRVQ
jgi:hypothetical protein